MTKATRTVMRHTWSRGELCLDTDVIVIEEPVALVYNGISHVVMMSTPCDLLDLALGFSLSEGILQRPDQMYEMELLQRAHGLELAMTVSAENFAALKDRRRYLSGRSGCGLCGIESLEQAIPATVHISSEDTRLSHPALQTAVIALGQRQSLKRETGGVHGAAWCSTAGEIELVREDIGRHNALDKLLGALALNPHSTEGFVLVTSRASYEMVAKAAARGIEVLAAVSAPTSLAVQHATQCNMTLVGFLQPGRQVVYSHQRRIIEET